MLQLVSPQRKRSHDELDAGSSSPDIPQHTPKHPRTFLLDKQIINSNPEARALLPRLPSSSTVPPPSLFATSPRSSSSRETSPDSLFDSPSPDCSRVIAYPIKPVHTPTSTMGQRLPVDQCRSLLPRPAKRTLPPKKIPGFYFEPAFRIPQDLADRTQQACMDKYFPKLRDGRTKYDQIQLFGRCTLSDELQSLLADLEVLMRPILPPEVHRLLFDENYHEPGAPLDPETGEPEVRRRQAILNLYEPGQGITPHVDFPRQYGDGIIGVSLGSGCVMNLRHELDIGRSCDLYLPANSVMVMTGEARWHWKHGIQGRKEDLVEEETAAVEQGAGERMRGRKGGAEGQRYSVNPVVRKPKAEKIARGMRMSVTFRWLLPGVGSPCSDDDHDHEHEFDDEDEEQHGSDEQQ